MRTTMSSRLCSTPRARCASSIPAMVGCTPLLLRISKAVPSPCSSSLTRLLTAAAARCACSAAAAMEPVSATATNRRSEVGSSLMMRCLPDPVACDGPGPCVACGPLRLKYGHDLRRQTVRPRRQRRSAEARGRPPRLRRGAGAGPGGDPGLYRDHAGTDAERSGAGHRHDARDRAPRAADAAGAGLYRRQRAALRAAAQGAVAGRRLPQLDEPARHRAAVPAGGGRALPRFGLACHPRRRQRGLPGACAQPPAHRLPGFGGLPAAGPLHLPWPGLAGARAQGPAEQDPRQGAIPEIHPADTQRCRRAARGAGTRARAGLCHPGQPAGAGRAVDRRTGA
ncbi:hypothetical protein D3C72_1368750 [compost metagenome]